MVSSRVEDQFKPACWICSWARRVKCNESSRALNPEGVSELSSFSRFSMATTGSPAAVCSISVICVLRRASKNFNPMLTASRVSAKTTTKETITPAGIS